MKRFHYLTNCTRFNRSNVSLLEDMIDEAREITYETFRRHCSGVDDWALSKGYELHPSRGLMLKGDYAVGFYTSKLAGHRCYYIRWSSIEYIWVEDAEAVRKALYGRIAA